MTTFYSIIICTLLSFSMQAQKFDHSSWTTLLQKHVSNEGQVHYKTFKTDNKELATYIRYLSKNTPNGTYSKEEKLAYWINSYNALTIDLILRHYPIKSIKGTWAHQLKICILIIENISYK